MQQNSEATSSFVKRFMPLFLLSHASESKRDQMTENYAGTMNEKELTEEQNVFIRKC
jgi:hypothetical protein